MSIYFELAFALCANRLCLFTGTGFSKAITNKNAPSWKELLEKICDKHLSDTTLKESLFPIDGTLPFHLEEAAQIIELELKKEDISINQEIANILKEIPIAQDDEGKIPEHEQTETFFKTENFRVVTTNYDKLVEELSEPDGLSLCPGKPIPRSTKRVEIYHVHGSVDVPENMVVTANDYFQFMRANSYFSQKLSTILHENTIVILGYSLGDTNLKAIINNYQGFAENNTIGNNIIFLSHKPVDDLIVEYYDHCYGIRIISDKSIEEFFTEINKKKPIAKSKYIEVLESLDNILKNSRINFSSDFLKIENSFNFILASIEAKGESLNNDNVVRIITTVISKKKELCGERDAWDQYVHLATWLTYIATRVNIRGTKLEKIFIEATLFSLNKMSKGYSYGFSWHAYKVWDTQWKNLKVDNKNLIIDYLKISPAIKNAESFIARG